MTTDGPREPSVSGDFPGWRATGIAAIVYAAAAAVATFPMVLHFATAMPQSGADGLQHLWVMRWYRSCLLEGRAPWFSAELQYPVGVPLGYFSPLHLQSLLYLPLSFLTGNDILIYNLIWSAAIVTTGLGTFVLGWYVLRDRSSAMVAGLLAMLSGPMRLHAYGHLELVTLGAFPLFLVLWMRFVDRPSRGRLLGAGGGYVLLAMSAAYYLVFAVFPAALYVVWRMAGSARRRNWRAIRRLAVGLVGFAGLVVPALLVLFSAHVWTIAHGYEMGRLRFEFEHYRAPLWSYLVPIPGDLASRLLPFNPYDRAGLGPLPMELISYLGIATLVLLHRAWFRRVAFVSSGYLWTSLGLMVVLSLGPHVQVGGLEVPMPAGWLWAHFPPMRMTRVPARFNLFAAVFAAVVAGAGLRDLLASRRRRAVRTALAMAVGGLAVADLSLLPFGTQTHPPMPAAYASLLERSPDAHILEAPHRDSGAHYLPALAAYWQSIHGGTTTAGYAGHVNEPYNDLVAWNSPFRADLMAREGFLDNPGAVDFEFVRGAPFEGYAWLYLKEHDIDHVMLHRWPGASAVPAAQADRLVELLRHAMVDESPEAVVFASERLAPPSEPVAVYTTGWGRRLPRGDRIACQVGPEASLVAYNPDPSRPVRLALEAAAFHRPRTVTIRDGERVLARWLVLPGPYQSFLTPPVTLPGGVRRLTIESDGATRPGRPKGRDNPPFSLFVSGISLKAGPSAAIAEGEQASVLR